MRWKTSIFTNASSMTTVDELGLTDLRQSLLSRKRSILRKEVLSQEVIQLIFFLIFKFLEFLSTSNASLQSTNRPYSSFPLRALSIYVDFTESYSLHIKNNVTHVIKLIYKVKLSNSTSLILSSHIISTA